MGQREPTKMGGESSEFPTTSWSTITRAKDKSHPDCRRAWDALMATYWKPLYSFARRRWGGLSDADAKDLVQEFLARSYDTNLLEKLGEIKIFHGALQTAFMNHIRNWHDSNSAQQRGGGRKHFSLEADRDRSDEDGDSPWLLEGLPEDFLHQEYVDLRRLLLRKALDRLEAEYVGNGKARYWEAFIAYHSAAAEVLDPEGLLIQQPLKDRRYAEIAAALKLTVNDVRNYLHHAKSKLRDMLYSVFLEGFTDHPAPQQGFVDLFPEAVNTLP